MKHYSSKTRKLIQQLIAIHSLSGHEEEITEFLKQYVAMIGLSSRRIPGGIVINVKGKNTSTAVIFNAHMDTVSEGNIQNWKYPPYGNGSGQVEGKRIFGLGSSDMKSSITSLLLLLEKFVHSKPEFDVWISFVENEETDGSGTKNFIQWFTDHGYVSAYQKIYAIVCEPTDLAVIHLGNKGNVFITLTVEGDTGHGSRPEQIKINAVAEASKIISAIEKNKNKILKKYTHPIMGTCSLGVTYIEGGESHVLNKFAEKCRIGLDFRFVARLSVSPETILKEIIGNYSYEYTEKSAYQSDDAIYIDKSSPIVRALSLASGVRKFGTLSCSSDLPTFVKHGIPTCVFGPGSINVIHSANEFCELDKIEKAVDIYRDTISYLE